MPLDKDTIRATNPLEQVVARYGVELKSAGRKDGGLVLRGHCPFHADSTPSFTVYVAQGTFYCFGCEAHGDVFAFVMLMEHVDFKRALEMLSGAAPPTVLNRVKPAPTPELELDDGHFAVMEAAAELYHSTLVNPSGTNRQAVQQAGHFLLARGIAEATIHHWRIGHAVGGQLARYLFHRKLDIAKAVEVGLIHRGDKGQEHLHGRITFPLTRDGETMFLIGRALGQQEPKYLGLPISKPLFYDGTDPNALEHDRCIVVEGPLDVLTLWQWGFQQRHTLIGLVGIHLKTDALALFERFGRIALVLDADSRGMEAARKLAAYWPERAQIVQLPEGKDVNDLARQSNGREVFDKLLRSAP